MNTERQERKKQRHHDSTLHGDSESSHTNTQGGGGFDVNNNSNPFASLPSKEAVASKGLEAKVDMATHGQKSWALTSLGAWRGQSLSSSDGGKSSAFVKSRQRDARRAMLGATGAATAAATTAGSSSSTTTDASMEEEEEEGAGGADCWVAGSVPPAKPPGNEESPSDMAVG